MHRYLARRFFFSLVVMWAVATLVFIMMQAIPGDPITTLAGTETDPQTIERLKQSYGLDKPVYVQYGRWFWNTLHGDLGTAFYGGRRAVTALIADALPRTFSLAAISFAVSVAIGVPAGILSAVKRNSIWDYLASLGAFLGLSMPNFWLGIILIILFSVKLHWLPAFGYASISEGVWSWLSHLILPAITTGTAFSAVVARQTRSAMLEVLNQDYIRTAYAKGLPDRTVLLRHALRNALIPVITVMGISLALLLVGAVIAENVFAIKGAGRLLIEGIVGRDYPVVQGMVLVIAGVFVFTNLVVDILYAFINPKIRYE